MSKPAIALITHYNYVSISTPIINTAIFWANNGYNVDLFMEYNPRFDLPTFDNPNIKTYIIKRPLNKFFWDNLLFAIKLFRPLQKYRIVIGYDLEGLISSRLVSFFWRIPFVYHSLEITNRDPKNLKLIIKNFVETCFARQALLIITQDKIRANLLSQLYKVNINKIYISYNSSIGKIIKAKSKYFHNKFGISKDKIIVLAVGSLIEEHSIDKIVKSVHSWPSNVVLVLHGWFTNENYKQNIINYMNDNPNKIYISNELLQSNKKYEIFKSADIGLVFFEPINDNLKYAAGSAGKLFDFMRTGVPVIGNSIPGMKELIEDNNLGVIVTCTEELHVALLKVIKNYNFYRKCSFKKFNFYEFNSCYMNIYEKIKCT